MNRFVSTDVKEEGGANARVVTPVEEGGDEGTREGRKWKEKYEGVVFASEVPYLSLKWWMSRERKRKKDRRDGLGSRYQQVRTMVTVAARRWRKQASFGGKKTALGYITTTERCSRGSGGAGVSKRRGRCGEESQAVTPSRHAAYAGIPAIGDVGDGNLAAAARPSSTHNPMSPPATAGSIGLKGCKEMQTLTLVNVFCDEDELKDALPIELLKVTKLTASFRNARQLDVLKRVPRLLVRWCWPERSVFRCSPARWRSFLRTFSRVFRPCHPLPALASLVREVFERLDKVKTIDLRPGHKFVDGLVDDRYLEKRVTLPHLR
ncbi:hypothetical protein R3P38DRAFT_2797746 [Favolaschia claudopus]|uniref:Uncharacterized protein n=1 Tax=Favolaschia claudopus TaxID=2862362 RepID=A0AAW0A1K7_9AGAR